MSLIHQKLSKIATSINPIAKSGYNKDDNYKFKSNEDVYNHIQPLIKAEGVFLFPEILESSETIINTNKGRAFRIKVKVKWTFSCQDGSSFSAVMLGEGIDPSDKGSNKAVTASLKYLLIYMFLVPAQYMVDADSTSFKIPAFDESQQPKPKEKSTEKPKSLLATAESKGLSRNDILKLGESLGIDIDKDLTAEERKKLFDSIDKL